MYCASKTKLYEGTNKIVLSMILLLMNIKSKHGWLDTGFNSLLMYELFLFYDNLISNILILMKVTT